MKDYDAYLFDWDGTIASSLAVWLPLVKEILHSYNIAASDKTTVRQVFGRPRQGLAELGVPTQDLPDLLTNLVDKAQELVPHAPLYPDAYKMLRLLQARGKKLGLITASARAVVDKTLQAHHLQQTFAVVITGSDVVQHKPDPEGILRALDQLGIAKDRAIMLGDSEKDIVAAHNAGIDSVLFYPSEHDAFHTLEDLQADKPTYTIRSWQELIDQLQ